MKVASILLGLMFAGAHALAMNDEEDWAADCDEPIIRLVFLGKTGAGKSTAINACYNFVQKTKWNDYPKWFPIPTEYQECNVEDYRNRGVECHEQGQLNAVTQKPSEYVAIGDGHKVSFIDCPGTADPRGVAQDNQNIIAAAEFLSKKSYCNAFCIVLKSATNRETIEELYSIEQIKSLLPLSARNRIFILATHDSGDRENISSFVQSVGLPTDNIFYFDNFALTREGHVDLCTINIPVEENEDVGDPFSGAPIRREDGQIAIAKKARATWLISHREFNKMIRRASSLGVFHLDEFEKISQLHGDIATSSITAVHFIGALEAHEIQSDDHRKKMASASLAKTRAHQAYESVSAEHAVALQRAANAAAPSNNSFYALAAEADRIKVIALQKYREEEQATALLAQKCQQVNEDQNQFNMLCRNRNYAIAKIGDCLVSLNKVTLCSLNLRSGDYYDVCIRREQNSEKRARLTREKNLYQKLLSK